MLFSGKEYKHIIWDFNGTILDDLSLCHKVISKLISKHNLEPICEITYQKNFELPVKPFYEKLGFDTSEESFNQIAVEWIKMYEEGFLDCNLQPHIPLALEQFNLAQKDQFILSAMEIVRLRQVVDHLGITKYFNKIYGTDSINGICKLHLAEKLLSENKVDPRQCIVIGDTLHDAELASEIGCDVILLTRGHQHQSVLSSNGNITINCISEILT